MSEDKITIVTKEELSLIEECTLNERQLQFLLKKTPSKYVRKRPAKGGGQWDYVSGGYVKKMLNLMFGFDWDFEIINEQVIGDQVIVKGKLTIRSANRTVIKMQFGKKDIICKKGTKDPLDLGNDFKAAATDCLKKCAAELGIAADIYNREEFREVNIKGVEIKEKRYE